MVIIGMGASIYNCQLAARMVFIGSISFIFIQGALTLPVLLLSLLVSQPNGPVSILEGSASVAQFALGIELQERVSHTLKDFRLNIQCVMRRKHTLHGQSRDLLKRPEIRLRVGGWIVGK